ncbi:MAG: RluA family pseudouridine synthase [Bacteroidales bacterium]|nr:RluA family pseudouridine synthase [Bacteroidales bacterium]
MIEETEELEVNDQQGEENDLFEHYRFEVDRGQALLRIDKFLLSKIPNISRNKIQNAAHAGNILVNQVPVKPNHKVHPLDTISIVLAYPPRETEIIAENIPLQILFEDQDLLVVDKPAGMVVHPAHGNYNGTLLNALAYRFQEEGIKLESGPYLVHRIDKDTSGLLLVAKNELAQSFLARSFFDHKVDRKYWALVWGDFIDNEGTINGHIGRCLKDRQKMDVFPDGNHGKEAITHYRIIRRFHYVTLVECILETGRTHQIRAHMKHIGHPLFNDAKYGGDQIIKGTTFTKYKQFIQNCFDICPRQALHAKTLSFKHPSSGKDILFESDLPKDFSELVEKWEKYFQSSIDINN